MALYAFDGTWNEDEPTAEQDTNVVRFRRAYQGDVNYIPGVGTRFGAIGKVFGGLFGAGGKPRIQEMYEALVANWKAGDQTIDITGFSRGAALAVHFSNVVAEGIREDDGTVIEANPRVRFLGVWDVVSSFGIPINGFLVPFHDINIGWNFTVPAIVDQCAHALALDERRQTFEPERLNRDRSRDNIEELWFRGVHSDIGGGNRNIGLNAIAFEWMMKKAADAGVDLDDDYVRHVASQQNRLAAPSINRDLIENDPRKFLPGDELHQSGKGKPLEVGQKARIEIRAIEKFCWSGVRVEAGATYEFRIAQHETWTDATIECGPEGWKTEQLSWFKEAFVRPLEDNRRVPDAAWFELIGSVSDDGQELHRIGAGGPDNRLTARRTGDLFCFANDVDWKYGNNSGALHAIVQRVS